MRAGVTMKDCYGCTFTGLSITGPMGVGVEMDNCYETRFTNETRINVWDPEEATSVAKVGRNAPCPCGSGSKYKRCHGS